MNHRVDDASTIPDIKAIQYILAAVAGFGLPFLGGAGKAFGVGILLLAAGILFLNALGRKQARLNNIFLIGFLCGAEIFFRDFALRGLFGYLAVEYILIALGIVNFPFLLSALSKIRGKGILFLWLLFCLWALLTLIYSQDVIAGRWVTSLYLSAMVVFLHAVSASRDERAVSAVLQGIGLGAFLVLGTALQFYVTSPGYFLYLTSYRFAHALCSPNQIAIAMAAGVIALVYLYLEGKRPGALILSLVLMAALVLTFSRGSLIGVIGSILILFILTRGVKNRLRLVFLIILLLPIIYTISLKLPDVFSERYQNVNVDVERQGIWETSLNAWRESPLFGYGVGSWSHVYPTFSGVITDAPAYVSDAHNILLQILVDMGGVGAFLFILFIISLSFSSIRSRLPLTLAVLILVFIVGALENWKISVIYMLLGVVLMTTRKNDNNRMEAAPG